MQLKNSNSLTAVIDIGATNTRFAVIDGSGKTVMHFRDKTKKSEKKILESLFFGLEKLQKEHNFQRIGISAAGPIRNEKVYFTNITGKYTDLVTPVKEKFNMPVGIINDCAAAVLAEQEIGQGKGKKSIVYVTISSGIGGGVIRNGHLVWFPTVKEEIGHMKIDSDYGLICKCGGIGHWQAFSSGLSIPHFYRAWLKKHGRKFNHLRHSDVIKIFSQIEKGNKSACDFFDEVSRINAKAIDALSEKYKPELIVLGGSVAQNNKQILMSGLKKHQEQTAPIVFTKLGDEVCLLGAYYYINRLEKNKLLV